jgi:hypothetical protein
MGQDWPSTPQHRDAPRLPVVDDLPVAWEGYDRASVDAAFESFYRHIAQLDSTLRTLEAVEAFREEATDLRADLRSIRAAGWSPYPRGYALAPERSLFGSLPPAVPRIALEVVFLVAVAAVVAVADFSNREIVGVMAGAVIITFLVELVASRDRRAAAPIPAPLSAEEYGPEPVFRGTQPTAGSAAPAVVVVDDAVGWAAFADATDSDAESAMGAVASEAESPGGQASSAEVPAAVDDQPGEPTEEAPALEELPPDSPAADEPQPVVSRRRLSRRARSQDPLPEPEPQPAVESKHVRVLPPTEAPVADDTIPPWERGFDETGEIR